MTDADPRKATRIEPPPTAVTQPFWDGTRREELLLQWCTACEKPVFYPREACPGCLGGSLEWRAASGLGEVYAVTIEHRPQMTSLQREEPFAVVMVELAEGVRLLSNVVGCPPEEISVGMPVRVTWEPLSDGRNLPQFTPA